MEPQHGYVRCPSDGTGGGETADRWMSDQVILQFSSISQHARLQDIQRMDNVQCRRYSSAYMSWADGRSPVKMPLHVCKH